MELYKTVPAKSWIFIYFLKVTKHSIKLVEKLPRRHLINSSDVFVIKGFTVVRGETPDQELWGFYLESFIIINQYSLKVSLSSESTV